MLHGRDGPHVWPPHTASAYCPHGEISRSPCASHVGLHATHRPSFVGPYPDRYWTPAGHAVYAWQW